MSSTTTSSSSPSRRSRSRSLSPRSLSPLGLGRDRGRDRAPSPGDRRKLLVARPRDLQERIPEEFLQKRIENIIFVITHSTICSTFANAPTGDKMDNDNGIFQTQFDTILTCDLGMFTAIMSGPYAKIVDTILSVNFPNTGTEVIQRLSQNIGKVGKLFRATTNIHVKSAGTNIADLDTFCMGSTPTTTINDGIFLYNKSHELPIGPIQLNNIARKMFTFTYPKTVYSYAPDGRLIMSSSCNPFVNKTTTNIKLSDILGAGKGLQVCEEPRISPDNTVVIVVTCRIVKDQSDAFPLQSPSPSSYSGPRFPTDGGHRHRHRHRHIKTKKTQRTRRSYYRKGVSCKRRMMK